MKTDNRPALLDKCRSIAEKAKREGRGLTAAEQTEIDSTLDEVRGLNGRAESERLDAADAASKKILGQLDAMASGRIDNDDSRRLVFTKGMADQAAAKILAPDYSGQQKAIAPSGSVLVGQEFAPDPIPLGRVAQGLLDVLPVRQHESPEYAYIRQTATGRQSNAAVVASGAVKPTTVLGLEKISASLAVVAHLSEQINRFWLIDAPSVAAFIVAELQFGFACRRRGEGGSRRKRHERCSEAAIRHPCCKRCARV